MVAVDLAIAPVRNRIVRSASALANGYSGALDLPQTGRRQTVRVCSFGPHRRPFPPLLIGVRWRFTMLQFSELNEVQRDSVVRWARSHDWGRDAVMTAGGALYGCVQADSPDRSNGCRRVSYAFTELHSLARWAGYR